MVKFHLDIKESGESPIFLGLYHRGKRIKVYTGKKIEASKWDTGSCRANPRKYKNNCIGFNTFLQELSDEVEKLVNENKPIVKADLKGIVDKANGKATTEDFYGFADSFLARQLAKGELRPISAKGYGTTVNHLKDFAPRLQFDGVTLDFYDKFVTYLKDLGLSPNSIGANIKRLKWFMTAALDRDLHSNVAFRKKAFKPISEETDTIYLTKEEIKKLAAKEMPDRLKRVADAFVINCYLGLRFSDLVQIQTSNFTKQNGLMQLQMVQEKTMEKVLIPVDPKVLPLLKKYSYTCPVVNKGKLMSVQKFNEYLKEAAGKAEIDSLEDIRTKGEVKKIEKHKLITSHTARRSFATNLYLEGVPTQNIMAITGHRKEETFLLYVRADQLTKSKGLANFYSKKTNRSPSPK